MGAAEPGLLAADGLGASDVQAASTTTRSRTQQRFITTFDEIRPVPVPLLLIGPTETCRFRRSQHGELNSRGRRPSRMIRPVATMLICVALVVGCTSSDPVRTVRGTVRVQGGPAPGIDKIPTSSVQVTVTPKAGGAATTLTFPNGTFELHLRDGTYDVQGGPTDISPKCSAVVTVTVSSSSKGPINLACPIA